MTPERIASLHYALEMWIGMDNLNEDEAHYLASELSSIDELKAENDKLRKRIAEVGGFDRIGADRLAYECAHMVCSGELDSRSTVAYALIDYLGIGTPVKTQDVPTWMNEYRKRTVAVNEYER